MGGPQATHGGPMATHEETYRQLMGNPWATDGQPVGNPWATLGQPMAIHGKPVANPWATIGQLKRTTRVRLTMDKSWAVSTGNP